MAARNTREQWGWVARLLHWATAALVVVQFGIALYIIGVDDLVARFEADQLHKSWGTVIFGVSCIRVAWRLASRQSPQLPASTPAWQRRLAHLSHAGLYVLLLVMPLSGWVHASAAPLQTLMGIENRVFGTFALPDPWPAGDERIADTAFAVHRSAAWLLLALLALHVGAALRHHFVDRDGVLTRMIRSR